MPNVRKRGLSHVGFLTVLWLSIPSLAGCAFGTRKPILSYSPITSPRPAKGIAVQVAPLRDGRFEKELIGYMRNGYGMRTAKVVTETNISTWVTDALKAELTNAGYTVTEGSGPVTINGEVLQVFCDAYLQYEGKVELSLTVRRGSEVLLQKKYQGTSESLNLAGTSKSYALTLEKSLQSALRDVIREIDARL